MNHITLPISVTLTYSKTAQRYRTKNLMDIVVFITDLTDVTPEHFTAMADLTVLIPEHFTVMADLIGHLLSRHTSFQSTSPSFTTRLTSFPT